MKALKNKDEIIEIINTLLNVDVTEQFDAKFEESDFGFFVFENEKGVKVEVQACYYKWDYHFVIVN